MDAAAGAASSPIDVEDVKRRFRSFLTNDDLNYVQGMNEMVARRMRRLTVNLDHLRAVDLDLCQQLLRDPVHHIPAMEDELRDTVLHICEDPEYIKEAQTEDHRFSLAFDGSLGANSVSPRTLNSQHVTQLVCVEGIATKCSLVRPKVVRSVHYCPATNAMSAREYRDASSFAGPPTNTTYPTRDASGNLLQTEYGKSKYMDHQSLSIQEMPERAPLGQLPRSVDVVLDGDLVDRCKPGDRVRIVGVYRAAAPRSGITNGLFHTVLIANHVQPLAQDVTTMQFDEDDIENIRELAKRDGVVDMLTRSIAPSIFGHARMKKALLLQLVGGMERILKNGTHLRGDVNVLMVGDPSTAKSQLMRFMLRVAPLAINTTGRGSSGVGLTAAVTTDQETGERRLEAGAMVLADRGVVCIDEFDKMSDGDRVAIHEVMEQQTVTIAKAGIHTSLNARCSVLAAANPVYGMYDASKSAAVNVAMPDSLLSRFDLLFIVVDDMDAKVDAAIADHVLGVHRYQRPGQEGMPIPFDAEDLQLEEDEAAGEDGDKRVFAALDRSLHGAVLAEIEEQQASALQDWQGDKEAWREAMRAVKREYGKDSDAYAQAKQSKPKRPGDVRAGEEMVALDFLRKYVQYAKARCKPTLTDGAREVVTDTYCELRRGVRADGSPAQYTQPITARQVETLIRLATAHAKLRLSTRVEVRDALAAKDLLSYALTEYAGSEEIRKRVTKAATLADKKERKVMEEEEEEEEEKKDGDEDGPEGGDGDESSGDEGPAGNGAAAAAASTVQRRRARPAADGGEGETGSPAKRRRGAGGGAGLSLAEFQQMAKPSMEAAPRSSRRTPLFKHVSKVVYSVLEELRAEAGSAAPGSDAAQPSRMIPISEMVDMVNTRRPEGVEEVDADRLTATLLCMEELGRSCIMVRGETVCIFHEDE